MSFGKVDQDNMKLLIYATTDKDHSELSRETATLIGIGPLLRGKFMPRSTHKYQPRLLLMKIFFQALPSIVTEVTMISTFFAKQHIP